MPAILKTTQIQDPSSATVNLALDTSGGVTVGQNLKLSGSSSGTTTLVAQSAASGTVTIAAQTGTIYPAGPAFSAYASATQTVTLNTATKVAIDTEEFDTNNNFDTTTNRFTPTVAGYYQVNGILRGTAATTFTQINLYLYKNGASYKLAQIAGTLGATNSTTTTISAIIYMNGTTDYLELWGVVNGSGTGTFVATSSVNCSSFSACLIRGA